MGDNTFSYRLHRNRDLPKEAQFVINAQVFQNLVTLIEARKPELLHQLKTNDEHDFVTVSRFLTRYFPIPVGWGRSEVTEAGPLFDTFYPVKPAPTPQPTPETGPDLTAALDALARAVLDDSEMLGKLLQDWANDYTKGKFDRDRAFENVPVPDADDPFNPALEIATETQV